MIKVKKYSMLIYSCSIISINVSQDIIQTYSEYNIN